MPVVLGYHGCSLHTAQALLGGVAFLESTNSYDWLGRGTYFWEADPLRAYDWATKRRYADPSVVGAVLDLGHCLDLTVQDGLRVVRRAYGDFVRLQTLRGQSMPANANPAENGSDDLVLRHLDRAVIDHLNGVQDRAVLKRGSKAFDTIRALFPEGKPLYPNAGFRERTHVQICVRSPEQILGVFRIPEHQREALDLPVLYGHGERLVTGLAIAAEGEE